MDYDDDYCVDDVEYNDTNNDENQTVNYNNDVHFGSSYTPSDDLMESAEGDLYASRDDYLHDTNSLGSVSDYANGKTTGLTTATDGTTLIPK